MAQNQSLRYQSAAPTVSTDAGIAHLFVDNSGVLKIERPGGDVYYAGQVLEQQLSGNVGGTLGGLFAHFVFQGPSGQKIAIPGYTLT